MNKKIATIHLEKEPKGIFEDEEEDANFLKQKLYEAETYIVSLEKDIETLNQESQER